MGGIFTTNVNAEHETPPIANLLLAVRCFSFSVSAVILLE